MFIVQSFAIFKVPCDEKESHSDWSASVLACRFVKFNASGTLALQSLIPLRRDSDYKCRLGCYKYVAPQERIPLPRAEPHNLSDELTTKSASELVALIRQRQVSPVDVVESHLRRIERINPSLNAIITIADDAIAGDFPGLPIKFVGFVRNGQTSASKWRQTIWSRRGLLSRSRASTLSFWITW